MLPAIRRNRVDSLFKDFMFDDVLSNLFETPKNLISEATSRLSNFSETKEGFELSIEVPGYEKSELAISVDNSILIIRGKQVVDEKTKRQFSCSYSLPRAADFSKARADLKNGILTLSIPKVESAKAREITIN